MPENSVVSVYIDYKSPYAYLAKDLACDLERRVRISLDWLPYILDIPSYLGSARLDESGRVIEENRNAHQWRRVKYSYMDCRRQARKRGLVIRGTQKIWDSTLRADRHALRQAPGQEALRRYHRHHLRALLEARARHRGPGGRRQGARRSRRRHSGVAAYLEGDGPRRGRTDSRDAEEKGVFGVPSFILDGELFWGREHLPDIRDRLAARNLEIAR